MERLTDLAGLALPPPPGERTGLASSYDRSSTYDVASDKYLNWGANGDGSGLIRTEGNESILAEITGPGLPVADLERDRGCGPREDLPGRPCPSGGRPALLGLF